MTWKRDLARDQELESRLPEVVRILRQADTVKTNSRHQEQWRGNDFRVICDCQRHASRKRSLLRQARDAAMEFKRSGIALLVGVPLAFGASQFPIEAMNIRIPQLIRSRPEPKPEFRIFTTPRVQREFLPAAAVQQHFSLDGVKEEFFRAEVPYGAIIYREATKNHLAPELVAAVVEAESDFRPRLVSGKNAQGLMQIIPSTGRDLGVDDLFNPAQNIAAGAKYLRYLHDRFGNERVALAAYNAGEGNVERFGGVPPFPETLTYLQRVSARSQQYHRRVRGSYIASSRFQSAFAAN